MNKKFFIEVLVVSVILHSSIDIAETILCRNMSSIISYVIVVFGLFVYCKYRDIIKNIIIK